MLESFLKQSIITMLHKEKPKDFNPKFEVVGCFFESDGKMLLLHRQDNKPQGGTWCVPGGKKDEGENLVEAVVREVREEIAFEIAPSDLSYFKKFFVRYDEYDFIYHIFHVLLENKPRLTVNQTEHKDYAWKTPTEALKENLIKDEDGCIKSFYNL